MEKQRAYGTGMWAWLLQRITGVLLVFYLFFHIWWLHFGRIETSFDFLLNILFVDVRSAVFILLLLVVPHALNGFRVFAIDLGINEMAQKILFWGLMLLGVAVIIFAYNTRFS